MNDAPSHFIERAVTLRSAFDRSFAEPARLDAPPMADLLALSAGSQACAVHLSEIAGLFADKKITRVPSRAAGLLGIAGFRGSVVPVYSLAAFLGNSPSEIPRWLVIASGAPVAFAFETFDFHLRVPRAVILPREAGERASKYVHDFVRAPDLVRPIVRLTSILDAVRNETQELASSRER